MMGRVPGPTSASPFEAGGRARPRTPPGRTGATPRGPFWKRADPGVRRGLSPLGTSRGSGRDRDEGLTDTRAAGRTPDAGGRTLSPRSGPTQTGGETRHVELLAARPGDHGRRRAPKLAAFPPLRGGDPARERRPTRRLGGPGRL